MQKAQVEGANIGDPKLSIAFIIFDTNQVWSSTYFYLKYEDKHCSVTQLPGSTADTVW